MSCTVMNLEPLAALANAVEDRLNCDFDFWGFEAPDSLHRELNDCQSSGLFAAEDIYRRLYALNVRAYNSRYRNQQEPGDEEAPTIDGSNYVVHHKRREKKCHADRIHKYFNPCHYIHKQAETRFTQCLSIMARNIGSTVTLYARGITSSPSSSIFGSIKLQRVRRAVIRCGWRWESSGTISTTLLSGTTRIIFLCGGANCLPPQAGKSKVRLSSVPIERELLI